MCVLAPLFGSNALLVIIEIFNRIVGQCSLSVYMLLCHGNFLGQNGIRAVYVGRDFLVLVIPGKSVFDDFYCNYVNGVEDALI